MSSTEYLKEAIRNIEAKGAKLTSKDVTTPTAAYFHPELDESKFLDDDEHTYYQSLIGVLQWLSELGRIDITFATSLMAKFSAAPRVNHLTYVLHIFSYLKSHSRSRLVFDHEKRDWSHRSSPTMIGRISTQGKRTSVRQVCRKHSASWCRSTSSVMQRMHRIF
jgi:hypothetical protein